LIFVVVDSGSQDETVEIARSFGARVFLHEEWPGFGRQKNLALSYLQTDWVLSLDADEVLTPELVQSISTAICATGAEVYRLSRLSSLCGRWMHHSGWRPDYVARLFRRGSASFSNDLVHERLLYQGEAPLLSGELLHYSFDSLEDVIDKMNRYSTAGALQRLERGVRRGGMGLVVFKAIWSFCRAYFMRCGFLDGREGFIVAVSNAEGTFYRQLKLLYLIEQERR